MGPSFVRAFAWLAMGLCLGACQRSFRRVEAAPSCEGESVRACGCGGVTTGEQVCDETGRRYGDCDCSVVTLDPQRVETTAGLSVQFSTSLRDLAGGAVVLAVEEGERGGSITQSGAYSAPAAAGEFHVRATANGPLARVARATIVVHPRPVAPRIDAPLRLFDGTTSAHATISEPGALLTYDWSIVGATFSSPARGTDVTFDLRANTSVVFLAVIASNAAGMVAAPTNHVIAVEPRPPPYYGLTILTPPEVPLGRASVPAELAELSPSLSYVWRVSGPAALDTASGPAVTYTPTASGTITLTCDALDPGGQVYLSQTYDVVVSDSLPEVSMVAGQPGGPGDVLAPVAQARLFGDDNHVIQAQDGTIYLSETRRHTIKKIVPGGDVTVFAGQSGVAGYAGGGMSMLASPRGLAFDLAGNLLVADSANCVVRQISPAGDASVFAGSPGVCAPTGSDLATLTLDHPYEVAVAADGTVFIGEVLTPTSQLIAKVAPTGAPPAVTSIGAPTGSINSGTFSFSAIHFYPFSSFTVASSGALIAVSLDNGASWVDTIGPTGVTSFTSTPDWLGICANSAGDKLLGARLISTESVGYGFPVTSYSSTPSGVGGGAGDTDIYPGQFLGGTHSAIAASPSIGPSGAIVADAGNGLVRAIGPFAGSGTLIQTVAGTRRQVGESPDGSVATAALLSSVVAIAVDRDDTIYIADAGVNKVKRIRGGAISTFVGTGTAAFVDGPPSIAAFSGLSALTLTRGRELLVGELFRIRRISRAGEVTTVAGSSGGAPLDGPVAAAVLRQVTALEQAPGGDIFFLDSANSSSPSAMLRVVRSGEVMTLTSGGAGFFDGGRAAKFDDPRGIAITSDHLLYVADRGNGRVRRVVFTDAEFSVSTLAGNGPDAFAIDGPCASATFAHLDAIMAERNGDLVVADNGALRRVSSPEGACAVATLVSAAREMKACTGSASSCLNLPGELARTVGGDWIIADANEPVVQRYRPW